MSIEVKISELPESVADATLCNWCKQVGEYVEKGENLADLETDKVTLDLVAPASGILKEIKCADGDTVLAHDVVAIIEECERPAAAATDSAPAATAPAPAPVAAAATNAKKASPAARAIAEQHGIDSADVSGSGRGGRITKADIKQHIANVSSARHEERVTMTRMRKRIAERLMQAQAQTAMLTTFNEVNMQPIMDLRKKYQDQFVHKNGIKLGFMSFFVKAAVEALKLFPAVNASIDGDDIIYHNYCDVGIAVSGPRGLVVPILRNSEQLDFAAIELAIKEFADKTKDGSLTIEEMSGGTFTITNGGTFGSMMSTPILNPPQSAILGMHSIVERAVVENGQIVARPMMYLALSYDHRIIDGREAVSFLVSIKQSLEDPARMLLNI